MELSIIIPVYRVECTLDRCVKSVLSQDYADMEVILVDDGSPDRCPAMCDSWALRDKRIHTIHKVNGGLSDARNTGIKSAKGEYVTFVDSDDFLAPDTYRPLMQLLEEYPETDLLEYPIFWHYGDKHQEVHSFGNTKYEHSRDYWLKGQAYLHSYACNKVFRRSLFSDTLFPVGKVFEDMGLLPRLLRQDIRVMTTDLGLYYYCMNCQGITATASGAQLKHLLDHHLTAMSWVCDTCYYMHVVNIQLDVCRLLHVPPTLPYYPVDFLSSRLDWKLRLKALGIKLLGIKNMSKLYALKKK